MRSSWVRVGPASYHKCPSKRHTEGDTERRRRERKEPKEEGGLAWRDMATAQGMSCESSHPMPPPPPMGLFLTSLSGACPLPAPTGPA